MRWWEKLRQRHVCYHHRHKRYLICHWVEKCGECKALRFTKRVGVQPQDFWPPESK